MQKITSKLLRDVFTTLPYTDRIVYTNPVSHNAMPETSPEHVLYKAVSNIAHGLGVTHDFSYEIMSRAVDVLAEAYDNADDMETFDVDNLAEDIDAIVPAYNAELLKIATLGNYHHIDEAREVFGNELDTTQACAAAWYSLIEMATQQLHEAITSYNDND